MNFVICVPKNFYFTLFCASACSTFGSYLYSRGYTRSSIAVLGIFISLFLFLHIAPWKTRKRGCVVGLGALCGGALFTPWLSWFLFVDPRFVVASLLATSVGFGCFLACNWSKRFLLVYYRALLLCVSLLLFSLLVESAVSGRQAALLKFQLHTLVLWFMVYVAVYSQEVVWKASTDYDYVKHAVSLYTDLPAVVLHVIMVSPSSSSSR
ncbi:Bax-mediated apoptosis inhibitor TEGT/BI-1 [Handroanthus impetiginosus]|uniref:Bax-mediated apoptosis inhibitor TEGT/BI-1 n=1 Tax=Handroanthus impetiginosus TaxID=429701 RepID=A0A2G9HLG1_9LAMI|nr:Bax-mediated apoptosis inhibitor TEGT/BI-1 [Handroanthus impetiginosus]